MNDEVAAPMYAGYRFPAESIGHAVWRYFRFALRYRDVEELLAERGVVVTYETVRQRCHKFGQTYANALRRRRPRPGDKWHLDEVFIRIGGAQHCGRCDSQGWCAAAVRWSQSRHSWDRVWGLSRTSDDADTPPERDRFYQPMSES